MAYDALFPSSRRIKSAPDHIAGGMVTIQADNMLPAALREQWPYPPRFASVNGWRMHYIDEGEGDPVVLLHGNPTWGFLYRDIIGPLVRSGRRVIVPDMIGFGLSEKPVREQAHTLDGHSANLTALMRQLDLSKITLVCHDWGGPTGLSFAMSNKGRIRALALMNTWAWPLPPPPRISHAHLSLAHDACAAGRSVLPRPPQGVCRPRRLSLGGRS
jgi:pimeloyl-ACP methyl ester carboxylesterase